MFDIVLIFEGEILSWSLIGINPLTPRSDNFFLQYPYIIQHTGNENTQIYQVEVAVLIYT